MSRPRGWIGRAGPRHNPDAALAGRRRRAACCGALRRTGRPRRPRPPQTEASVCAIVDRGARSGPGPLRGAGEPFGRRHTGVLAWRWWSPAEPPEQICDPPGPRVTERRARSPPSHGPAGRARRSAVLRGLRTFSRFSILELCQVSGREFVCARVCPAHVAEIARCEAPPPPTPCHAHAAESRRNKLSVKNLPLPPV